MVSLEQIRKLEQKVHAAVTRISVLTEENETLRTQVSEYERRLGELQQLVDAFKHDQDEIEAGIVSVLKHLDQLEDRVGDPDETPASQEQTAPQTAPNVPPADATPAPADLPEHDEPDEDEEEPELDIF